MDESDLKETVLELGPLFNAVSIDASENHRSFFLNFEDDHIRIETEAPSKYLIVSADIGSIPKGEEVVAFRTLLLTNGLTSLNEGTWFGLDGGDEGVTMHFRISLEGETPHTLYQIIAWFRTRVTHWRRIVSSFGNGTTAHRASNDPGAHIVRG
ncbi:MAG: type III secretion system chaperone [Pseudomonadota bacterium]